MATFKSKTIKDSFHRQILLHYCCKNCKSAALNLRDTGYNSLHSFVRQGVTFILLQGRSGVINPAQWREMKYKAGQRGGYCPLINPHFGAIACKNAKSRHVGMCAGFSVNLTQSLIFHPVDCFLYIYIFLVVNLQSTLRLKKINNNN